MPFQPQLNRYTNTVDTDTAYLGVTECFENCYGKWQRRPVTSNEFFVCAYELRIADNTNTKQEAPLPRSAQRVRRA